MKKIIFSFFVVAILICGIVLYGCSSDSSDDTDTADSDEATLTIAVSIVPEATFVKEVCGDLADVITLVPAGYSPESYEPTAEVMETFSDSDVYFTIGVPTESSNILPDCDDDMNIVYLEDIVADSYDDRTFESSGERDPHIWLSIERVEVMVQAICDEVSELDPDNADTYQENADDYIAELEDANTEIESILADYEGGIFIVNHPAWGYFADDYGLEMYALEEEGKDVTTESIQELVDLAEEKNLTTVFYQSENDISTVESFAEEIDGSMEELTPLSADYIENLIDTANLLAESWQ